MGKNKLGILFLSVFVQLFAVQSFSSPDSTDISRKGLFINQTTISPGVFFNEGLFSAYFHPSIEYFFEDKVSIRTDAFYFFTTQGNYKPFSINHTILLGAFYHFNRTNASYYLGWQPGAAFVKMNDYVAYDSTITNPGLKVSPIFSLTVGANYYFLKYLNFFAAINYVHGTHIANFGDSIPLDELRFSIGLGWNLRCLPKHKPEL